VIVADASVVVELLLRGDRALLLDELLLGDEPVAVPHLLDLEVAQVLRRWAARGALSAERAGQAVGDLADLPFSRQPHQPLLERVWQLRHRLTAYDAVYLALAEVFEARLATCDAALAAAAADSVEVVVPALGPDGEGAPR
jgi:predicted nucleic acid-binding protein